MRSRFAIWLLIVFCTAVAGCRKSPWRTERYIDKKTEDVVWSQQFPSSAEYSDYFVNEAFIEMRVVAHDEALHSASAPYYLVVNGIGRRGSHETMKIYNLTITSSLGNEYEISDAIGELQKEYEFASYADKPSFAVAHCRVPKEFNFDFKAGEILNLMLDVEVSSTNGKKQRKQIGCEFTPELEQGRYEMIHH